ncbi:Rho GTPase activation protein [Sporodiniella umbellata]|nr:Rho GTPase activation protein [Sporodiniella umbellata]
MTDQKSGMIQSLKYPQNGSIVSRAVAAAAANSHHSSRNRGRVSKRYPVSAFLALAAEEDVEVEDELAKAQKNLRELKTDISIRSKKNFTKERDVRFLDARIGLLIQNKMALDEQHEVASRLEEQDDGDNRHYPDEKQMEQYGNLFYLLQTEPRHIATLCRLVSLTEIDNLLQTVMFTLYGNQYESREEHLLLTMFQNVLAAQFETTAEFSSLLRANTPVSRMMTTYTRRGPGQSYLKSVLSEKINALLEDKNLNLQINPLKVYEELVEYKERELSPDLESFPKVVTAEAAASNLEVQSIIQPRLEKLISIAEELLVAIISSLNNIPYGIRWICKQIRSLTKRKYPEATEHAVSSLIGGFFFLRFVNPAIVTPQAYMLVDRIPGQNTRITLTLLAKMIQNLANKPSYSKEAYMIPTNPFVEANKKRTNKFLNELCEIGDFYEQLEMDQYMALSKKDIMISITPNEVYNTLSLLNQHIGILAPKETDHLHILVREVGAVPAQVLRKENKAIELPLFSRWEMPIQGVDLTMSLMSENDITQNDILYMEAKSIFIQIIRSLPNLLRVPLKLKMIAQIAATSNDDQLVCKGIKVISMLKELEDFGVIDCRDDYRLLVEEITQELVHLGDLKVKVMEELKSLKKVHETICDHNTYLDSQLESYRAYLQNVRIQSSNGAVSGNNKQVGIGVEITDGKATTKRKMVQGPYKFPYVQLEKEGVIVGTELSESDKGNSYLAIFSPTPGTFIVSLLYQGRDNAVIELSLTLDDLLEKQQKNIQCLSLEFLQLHVSKTLQLLTKTFITKNKTGFFS